jgi:hypothetical protein
MRFAKKYYLSEVNPRNATPGTARYDPLENPDERRVRNLSSAIEDNISDPSVSLHESLQQHGQLMREYLKSVRQHDQPGRDIVKRLLSGKTRGLPATRDEDPEEEGDYEKGSKTGDRRAHRSSRRDAADEDARDVDYLLGKMRDKGFSTKDGGIRKGRYNVSPVSSGRLLRDAVGRPHSRLASSTAQFKKFTDQLRKEDISFDRNTGGARAKGRKGGRDARGEEYRAGLRKTWRQ